MSDADASSADESVVAYIGIGSNLDTPQEHVCRAISELQALAGTVAARASSLYRNPPMGPPDQPDYVNAALKLGTPLAPLALVDELQRIERAHGRVRNGERWGPRTLDLDLLLFGDQIIHTERLTVPHAGIAERVFVLVPLFELDPDLEVPGLGSVRSLLDALNSIELERLH